MSRLVVLCVGAVAWLLLSACGGGTGRSVRAVEQNLPPRTAALVGRDAISIQTVGQIARARGVSPGRARELAVEDALFAAGSRRWSGMSWVSSAVTTSLARALLEQIKQQALSAGPPSDAEVARLTAEHWADLDRPSAARTTHAVVIVKKPAEEAKAKALAERIAHAVRGVRDPTEFKRRARAVPTGGLEVRVEDLPPVTADGRVVPPHGQQGDAGRFDSRFAAAANAIAKVGGQSPVVRSAFGYHVILLDQRLPEKRVPLEARRAELTDQIIDDRARAAKKALLTRLQHATRIEVARDADALTARVQVRR